MWRRIQEFGFRELYHKMFLVFDDESSCRAVRKLFPAEPGDNAVLVYGYIDSTAGITFEVLCSAFVCPDWSVKYREGRSDATFKIRYESVKGFLREISSDELAERFESKLEMVDRGYRAKFPVLRTRNDTTLDPMRNAAFPDDILVYFVKDGLRTEAMWCRVAGKKDGYYVGVLLNRPAGDFGVKCGDLIRFECVDVRGEKMAAAIL